MNMIAHRNPKNTFTTKFKQDKTKHQPTFSYIYIFFLLISGPLCGVLNLN